MFHPIELDRWERKDTFQNFMDLDCSYSVTQDLCVTPFHAHVRARGLRFYPAFSWAVAVCGQPPQGIPNGAGR